MDKVLLRQNIRTPQSFSLKAYYREGLNDWNVIESALAQDEYMLDKLPFNHGVGIDLGAHIGGVTLKMASMGMKVYAVEALPENAKLLQMSVDANNFGEQIKVYQNAIGLHDGDIAFGHYGDKTNANGQHHRYVGQVYTSADSSPGVDTCEIRTISLDTIFRENKITQCDILKTDCEGGEWACFEGASKKNIAKIEWILAELHPYGGHPGTTVEFMRLLHGMFEDVSSKYSSDPTFHLQHCILHRKK